jgi:cytochrome c55X
MHTHRRAALAMPAPHHDGSRAGHGCVIMRNIGVLAVAVLLAGMAAATGSAPMPPEPRRQAELLRLVRHECGSCHGLRLTGGLGPPLTREAMADKPLDSMTATIFGGRPGTPMPPWRTFMSEAEARWIAERLAQGLGPVLEAAR